MTYRRLFSSICWTVFLLILLHGLFPLPKGAAEAAPAVSAAFKDPPQKVLKNGWYLWDPYQYIEAGAGFRELTGLDVRVVLAISQGTGYQTAYEEVSWKQHIQDLKTGHRHMAAGATKTPEREEFAYFSLPYRREENALYFPKGESKKYHFSKAPSWSFSEEPPTAITERIKGLLQKLRDSNLRLGIVDGFVYAHPAINEFINDPQNLDIIVRAKDDLENLQNLIDKKIEGFLADRIAAATTIWRSKAAHQVEEVFLKISTPIHLMFSKASVSKDVVESFNKRIKEIKENGQYGAIVNNYLFPVILLQTVEKPWFFIIDLIGTIAFAISGLVVAYRERTSLVGAFIMAALPSVGGGVLRDVMVNRGTLGILMTPVYVYAICATVISGYLFIKLLNLLYRRKSGFNLQWGGQIVQICDALGLAAFTITGVVIAVMSHCEPLWLWGPILAAITGAGGGILRDLLRTDRYIVSLRGEFYAEVSLIWGFFLSCFLIWQRQRVAPDEIFTAIITVLVGGFLTRMLAINLKLKGVSFK